ncbi:MAG TPA: hypothetical protein VJ960_04470 [Oceanipulchritudo sp.]|nr:hypothetical protein [Oceanipulchritudo sp.]
MSQGRTGKINYRCPKCLDREVDYDLLFDREENQFYCRRCNWEGNELEILTRYAHYKSQYRDMLKRWTVEDILAKDEDNWE